jgi:integrase
VYQTTNGKYQSFKIVWGEGRTRRKESSPDPDKAIARAEEILEEISNGGSTKHKAYIEKCEAKLPAGVTLEDAVDWYVSHVTTQLVSPSTGKVVHGYLNSRAALGKSERYLDALGYALNKVSWIYQVPISEVTTSQLDSRLSAISSSRTRKNVRGALISCWRWAQNKGYLPHGTPTAADRTEAVTVITKDPEVLTPLQLLSAFKKAIEDDTITPIIPYLAIAAFAAVRSAEIERMTWEDNIDLEHGTIILGSAITKTKRRRVITMDPTLVEWLTKYKGTGKVCPPKPHRMLAKTHSESWPHNALRHSGVSYLTAKHQNAAMVAEQCGHTESQLQTSYKAAVTPLAAREWFVISPKVFD